MVITRDTLDGWHIDAAAAPHLTCRCTFSLDLSPALARHSGVSTAVALRCAAVADGVALLCAAPRAAGWTAALAFFQLPSASSAGAPLPPFARAPPVAVAHKAS